MRKIGIYGGTFDPIHHAHLILAREAREQLDLAQIIFVPATVSPFKGTPAASPAIRLAMIAAAIGGESEFTVDDFELRRPAPSYTIDTIEHLRRQESAAELHYLLGQDNVRDLTRWHRFQDLERAVRFVVLDRTGESTSHAYRTVTRKIDISATEIRKRVASHQSIRYLVPAVVEEIIRRENLYQEK